MSMREANAIGWMIENGEARLYDTTGTVMIAVDKGPDGKGLPSVYMDDPDFCYGFKPGELEVREPIFIQGVKVEPIAITCTDYESSIFFPINPKARDVFLAPIMANENVVMTLETGKVFHFENENGREIINKMLSLDGGEYE